MNNILKKYLLLALSLILIGTLPIVAAESRAEQWSYPSKNPKLRRCFQGSGTASSPYLIQSAQDLANLAYIVTDANNNVTGKHFKMTRDIYLNDFTVDAEGNITNNGGDLKEWTPIGEFGAFKDDDFQGIFDGDGHTIYGLYVKDQKREYVGLFGSIEDATIKNLNIKNAYVSTQPVLDKNISAEQRVGTLVGYAVNSNCSNVHIEGSYMQWTYDGTKELDENVHWGGLMGYAEGDLVVTDCSFDGNIQFFARCSVGVGGIVGTYYVSGYSTLTHKTLRVTRCQTNGSIKINKLTDDKLWMSGFVGSSGHSISYVIITDCVNRLNLIVNDDESCPHLTRIDAQHFASDVIEARRSANFGNITLNSKNIDGAEIQLTDFCRGYYDCVNYGHYFFPKDRNETCIVIAPGTNQLYHDADGKNLIVWKEAQPTDSLREKDKYLGDTTALSLDQLADRAIVAKLNSELGQNVWGFTDITEDGKTYSVPLPISCGGELSSLYENEKGQLLISSEADLRTLQRRTENGSATEGSYYLLTQDIDLSRSTPLEQIGDDDHPFTGTFDGDGHVISGATIKGHALFGNLAGTVKNLALLDMRFIGSNAFCAPFVYKAGGSADATITDCYAGGTITLGDSTNATTTLAGLIYQAQGNKVNIHNAYFCGIMANATNLSSQVHAYCGLVGNNQIGSKLTLTDCYSIFDFNDKAAVGTGIMPLNSASDFDPDKANCHFLCPRFSDAEGKVTTHADLAACFAGKDGWISGIYRPILDHARRYTLTDYQGQTAYTDAIPMDDDSCRNDIFCHTLTTETTNDPLLWALPNVALCDTATHVNRIVNCNLSPDAPFRFTPPTGSETKGLIHYPLTYTGDYLIRLMCLPGTLHKSDLPEEAHLFVMGTPIASTEGGYSSYTIECDSVPAGIPFLIYITASTDSMDIALNGEIVSEPQTSGKLGNQVFESGLIGTFDTKHLNSGGCANIEIVSTDVKIKHEDNIDLRPFSAYIDADADVVCDGGILLDEMSDYIADVIDMYKDWKVVIYLKRRLYASGWNTLCIPFDMTDFEIMAKWGYGTKVEELTSLTTSSDGTCTLGFTAATSIKAGKCYLVKPKYDDITCVQLDNKALCTDSIPTTLTASDGSFTLTFHGSFARKILDGSDTSKGTYFTQDNKIYKVADGHTIPMNGFRCWIETSKPNVLTKAQIAHSDGTTSIANVICIGTTKGDNRIYDLQGIEVRQPLRHHIYIKNNRKGSQTH